MMSWETLLTEERYAAYPGKVPPPTIRDVATTFQEDIERILYSSAFRRLQNKTQVHPLPKTDYSRTRLTHSLEVAQVARIIGTAIGKTLLEERLDKRPNSLPDSRRPGDIGDIVYAASLAHDVGN